jgi:hypothetical protein
MIGEFAEYVLRSLGKLCRLYTIDRGGVDTIRPQIDLGVIELVECGTSDPWIFLNQACKGKIRDKDGKWFLPDNSNIGLFAFESLTSFSDAMMSWMAKKAGEGVNIGGGANTSFSVSGDGETVKISGSNMAHYGVCQSRVTEEAWESQRLPAPFVIWTASVNKDDDTAATGKILGPAVAGKALTDQIPRWFNYTFRIDALPAENGQPEKHVLYLGNTRDKNAGGAVGLGNTRTPLDSPPIAVAIEPASIVKALQLIESGSVIAREAVAKRLGKELLDKVKALKVSSK